MRGVGEKELYSKGPKCSCINSHKSGESKNKLLIEYITAFDSEEGTRKASTSTKSKPNHFTSQQGRVK